MYRRNSLPMIAMLTAVIISFMPLGELQTHNANAALAVQRQPAPLTMPVYTVTQSGLTPAQAHALTQSIDVKTLDNQASLLTNTGAVHYTAGNFLAVPRKTIETSDPNLIQNEEGQAVSLEGFDLEALQKLPVLEEQQAVATVNSWWQKSNLSISAWGPIEAQALPGHSYFQIVDKDGQSILDQAKIALDTQVNYTFSLNGIPLIGPGADMKVVFNGEAQVTMLNYAMRRLVKGKETPILNLTEAIRKCEAATLANPLAQSTLTMQAHLVYYAPPLDLSTVNTIFPYYVCEGSMQVGQETVPLRRTLIPAIRETPQILLKAQVSKSTVTAKVAVSGGTPPYTFTWNSTTTPVALPNAAQVSYPLALTQPGQLTRPETVSVSVRDANGLETQANTVVLLGKPASGRGRPERLAAPAFVPLSEVDDDNALEVGTEWIGTCGGLGGSAGNAGGFTSTFSSAGAAVNFNWGEFDAWEKDFIDPSQRSDGLDPSYSDNVDFVFYTGHANGDGYVFCSSQADGFVGYGDGLQWGNKDLEWLVIAACGPLQEDSGGVSWQQRWGPAFDGLHLLMGYQTVTFDNSSEGQLLAQYALAGQPLRDAWAQTAIDVQGPTEFWAVMGPIGPVLAPVNDYNDHLWGYGPVGPDFAPSSISSYWMISGPS